MAQRAGPYIWAGLWIVINSTLKLELCHKSEIQHSSKQQAIGLGL